MSNGRKRFGWSTISTGTLGVLAYVAQMIIGLGIPGWLFITITIIGALATISAVLLAERRVVTARQAAEKAARNQKQAFQDVLIPLALNLGQIVSSNNRNDRKILQQQMKQVIIALTAKIIGPEDTRACLLEQVPNTETGQRELKCLNNLWHGRSEAPVTVFKETELRGKELLKLHDEGKSAFVPNVRDLPPALQPESNSYKTYITATVIARDEPYGVLCIDSLKTGDLSQDDVKLVEVLARLLGAALAVKR